MDTHLIIDPDTCVGYGECVAEDAAAVELDEHGCARALLPRLPQDRADQLLANALAEAASRTRPSAPRVP